MYLKSSLYISYGKYFFLLNKNDKNLSKLFIFYSYSLLYYFYKFYLFKLL
jgi:hypothetical protein